MDDFEIFKQFALIENVNWAFILLITVFSVIACSESSRKSSELSKEASVSPLSILGLQNRSYKSTLRFEKKLEDEEKYYSKLVSYMSDSLKIYALVNVPKSVKPKEGYPILIFGHGFHPQPKKYGISSKTGNDWRPGDYYRGVPESYAERGFLVITPDYRGHNISEGDEFTQTSYLASAYYAIDVLNLISTLDQIEEGDQNNIFYLGHSMGGDVGLKTLLVSKQIKAASMWAAVSASTLEQVLYYDKLKNEDENKITNVSMQQSMGRFNEAIGDLNYEYILESGDAINYIEDLYVPLIIHHAQWETSVPYQWSASLVSKLFRYNKEFEFYTYDSENHLFHNINREKAIQRDINFFNTYK